MSAPQPNVASALTAPLLRDVAEMATDAIYTIDARNCFLFANAATGVLLGLPAESLAGRSVLTFIDPDDRERLEGNLREVFSGVAKRIECRVVRDEGSRRQISVAGTPLTVGGSVIGMLCIARDVTEEREQGAELARSEARYTRLADSAEDAVATVDLDGRLTSVNRILEVVTGRSKDALYGTSFLDYIDHDERLPMQQMLAATIAGLRRRRDLAFTYADGRKGVSTVLSAPIREDGLVVGALLVARDVTEERMRLEQIARRDRLAAIGELVGSVAHEINSPLTGILAFAQILLAQGGLSTDGRQAAETIETEAKRAARTVRNLLTFARQMPPERVPTDLNQVLQDALALRRHSIEALGIVLEVGLKARLPVTWADPTQLQQVVLCLLTNAEQAVTRAAGERRITVRSSREGESLIMSVADSGHGIAPEHLPHIFNPFYTTKPRGIGTGLGLSISHGIVREHHGSLRVHSEPGQGARFEVVLPLLSPSATHPV